MGSLVVGTVTSRHLTLANDSICNLQYRLIVEQLVNGPYGDDELQLDDDTPGTNSVHARYEQCIHSVILYLVDFTCRPKFAFSFSYGAKTYHNRCKRHRICLYL